MKTCTKKTHTRRVAEDIKTAIENVCRVAKISGAERLAVIFHYGCLFIEQNIPDAELAADFLTKEEMGFWAWWVVQFAEDDKMLLMCYQNAGLPPGYSYRDDKEYMLWKASLLEEFKIFITALIKRTDNEKV